MFPMPFPPVPKNKAAEPEASDSSKPKIISRQSLPVINLTLNGLDADARAALERSLVAASKSGRFMISVYRLELEEGNAMLVMRSDTVKSGPFPIQEFNLCQDHFHQHLAELSAQVVKDAKPLAEPEGETVGQI